MIDDFLSKIGRKMARERVAQLDGIVVGMLRDGYHIDELRIGFDAAEADLYSVQVVSRPPDSIPDVEGWRKAIGDFAAISYVTHMAITRCELAKLIVEIDMLRKRADLYRKITVAQQERIITLTTPK